MAVVAATVAMDTKASPQVHAPTNRAIAFNIAHHIQHDVSQWLGTSIDVAGGSTNSSQLAKRPRQSIDGTTPIEQEGCSRPCHTLTYNS